MRRTQAARLSLYVIGVFLGGCPTGHTASPPAPSSVTRTAEQDGVKVTMTSESTALESGNLARLRITVEAEAGVSLFDFDYGRTLAEGDLKFETRIIRSKSDRPLRTNDGRLRFFQNLDLEFILPGEYELPPVTVSYQRLKPESGSGNENASPDQDATPLTLATEPISITVKADPSDELSMAEIRNVKRLDPVELPTAWSRWWWAWTAGVVLLLAIAITWLIRRRRRKRDIVVPIPAHEWAQREISALLSEDLIARGLVQEFYYRISGIVRGYIERRFGVCAPEMTTEEFLSAARDHPRLSGPHTEELQQFLLACDLVKYARYQPGPWESDAVLRAACDFVERTRVRIVVHPEGAHALPREQAA